MWCARHDRCACLVSVLQPTAESNHLIWPTRLLQWAVKCKYVALSSQPTAHAIIPIINRKGLLVEAAVAWSEEDRCECWGQTPVWVRDKLIQASALTLYVVLLVSLWSNVDVTSLLTPLALRLFLCVRACVWVRWLFAEALSVSSTKSYSMPKETKQRDSLLQQRHLRPGCWVQIRTKTLPWVNIKIGLKLRTAMIL